MKKFILPVIIFLLVAYSTFLQIQVFSVQQSIYTQSNMLSSEINREIGEIISPPIWINTINPTNEFYHATEDIYLTTDTVNINKDFSGNELVEISGNIKNGSTLFYKSLYLSFYIGETTGREYNLLPDNKKTVDAFRQDYENQSHFAKYIVLLENFASGDTAPYSIKLPIPNNAIDKGNFRVKELKSTIRW